jgi:hypothetical protein
MVVEEEPVVVPVALEAPAAPPLPPSLVFPPQAPQVTAKSSATAASAQLGAGLLIASFILHLRVERTGAGRRQSQRDSADA